MYDAMDVFICYHCKTIKDRDMSVTIGELRYCEDCAKELKNEVRQVYVK